MYFSFSRLPANPTAVLATFPSPPELEFLNDLNDTNVDFDPFCTRFFEALELD